MTVKGISVVVPFLNEEEIITQFCAALDTYQKSFTTRLELIFVDDGSQDDTVSKIKNYEIHYISKVKIVSIRDYRNLKYIDDF